MKRQASVTRVPILCLLVVFSFKAHASWNGIGVSGGTGGSDICNTANWVANTIDGDFTSINGGLVYVDPECGLEPNDR